MNTDCTPRYPTLTPEEIATMDAASRLRYLDAMLDEGDDDDDPGIPHEQVMAKARAHVEKLLERLGLSSTINAPCLQGMIFPPA